MSRGHEAAVKSCCIHTRGNVAGTFIRSSQQGQSVFTHTQSQLQLLRVPGTCTYKVSHCLSSSCHTISHLCFVTATCPQKFIWSNFMRHVAATNVVKRTRACVCSFTTDLTNHRQPRNGNAILSCLRICDKHSTGRKYMDNYIVLPCNKDGNVSNVSSD